MNNFLHPRKTILYNYSSSFNGCLAKPPWKSDYILQAWMSNYIPPKMMYMITYPNCSIHNRTCHQGAVSVQRCCLTSIGIPMLKIRRSCDPLIFNMGIPIPGKTVFILKQDPGSYCWYYSPVTFSSLSSHCNPFEDWVPIDEGFQPTNPSQC